MEIAIYSIFNVARVVAAAPNYTSNAVWQSGRQAKPETEPETEAEPQAEAGTGPVSSSVCAALSLSLPSTFYLPPSPCVSERGRRSEESHTNAIKLALGQINCSQRKWQATSKERRNSAGFSLFCGCHKTYLQYRKWIWS